ncbi:UBA/TS-N domain-containing protein [Ditylenchus destructor]|uniref:UBA/TS-N domain-containing protein n=1 Tax=Ditylenchus destructor TaxID=166010 RepID=A0AAD4MZT9_9BILA|nr:UBA/TS-N domain-containing protein [Ditylenchus destructor]
MPTIVFPDGQKREAVLTKTVAQVLQELCTNSDNQEYALVFYGDKLSGESRLADVQHIDETSSLYLVHNNAAYPSNEIEQDLDKQLSICKKKYEALTDDGKQKLREQFQGDNLKKIITEHPALYHDQPLMSLIYDYKLLAEYLFTKENFAQEHPYAFVIFKTALESSATKPANSLLFMPPANLRPSTSAITADMLQQAMATVFTGLPSQAPVANTTTQAAPSNAPVSEPMEVDYGHLREAYASQLTQMRDFGFTDDEENLRALQACEGNVEAALELVISIRE